MPGPCRCQRKPPSTHAAPASAGALVVGRRGPALLVVAARGDPAGNGRSEPIRHRAFAAGGYAAACAGARVRHTARARARVNGTAARAGARINGAPRAGARVNGAAARSGSGICAGPASTGPASGSVLPVPWLTELHRADHSPIVIAATTKRTLPLIEAPEAVFDAQFHPARLSSPHEGICS